MPKAWHYKVFKRGKHGGEAIDFFFQNRAFARSHWYPPWQNHLARANAQQVVADLNAAFALRKHGEKAAKKKPKEARHAHR